MAGPSTESGPMGMDVDDEDVISLTSTIEEEVDSDQEWLVESVQAEAEIDGETKYLINWSGYPLWDASWEPKENLSSGLLADWEESKKKESFRRQSNQNIAAWRSASLNRLNDQLERHRLRNRERAKQGLEQTTATEERWTASIEFLDMHPTGEESEEDADGASSHPSQLLSKPTPTLPHSSSDAPTTLDSSPIDRKSSNDGQGSLGSEKAPDSQATKTPHVMLASVSTQPVATQHQSANVTDAPVTQTTSNKRATKSALASKLGPNKSSKKRISEPGPSQLAIRRVSDPQISNVFIGGTVRKQRRTLLDTANDPNKAPQPLRHRYQRLLEKGSRDREGIVPPAKKPNHLFCLDPEAQNRAPQKGTSKSVVRPPTPPRKSAPEVETSRVPSPNGLRFGQGSRGTQAELPSLEGRRSGSSDNELAKIGTITKRKSVHFDYNPAVQDPMEISPEEDLFVPENTLSESQAFKVEKADIQPPEQGNKSSDAISGSLKSAIKTSSLDDHKRRSSTQDITKTAKIGSEDPKFLSFTFVGLPRKETHSWVPLFEDEEALDFTHTCTAKDFFALVDRDLLKSGQLCKGIITWSNDPDGLEAVADRLKLASRGILCHRPEFGVLVYPSKCEDWEPEAETSKALSAASPLSFRVLQPDRICGSSWLAPLGNPLEASDQDPPPGVGPMVYHQLFGLNYSQLLPPLLQDTTNHTFFLAFSRSANREATFIAQWLRSCNPDCKLLSSMSPGHWFSFVPLKKGVIIVDEDVVPAIRHFPGFCNVLHESKGSVSFWMLTKSLREIKQFTSDADSLASIGDIYFRPIFGPGVAVLMTPSLLLSQPQQSYRIVKWFWKRFVSTKGSYRRGKLVLCDGIADWLFELTLQQSRLQDQSAAADVQRHRTDIQDRLKTLNLIREISETSINGKSNPIVYASELIDGNDEQSLVNWFGWWSIMNVDRFRTFYVVGSDDVDPKRLRRRIKLPKYYPSVVANPDELYMKLDRQEQNGPPLPVNTLELPSPGSGPPLAPKSRFTANDEGHRLRNHLFDRSSKCKTLPMVLYGFPVSYWNPDMRFHFRDYDSAFINYSSCFKWFLPFETGGSRAGSIPASGPRPSNTMVVLFYTIETRWDAAAYPQDIPPTRRPWIAIFRPANLHRRPWSATEVLIWDFTSKKKWQDKDVYEEDLIEAQMEWIRLVADDNKIKNPRMPLSRVWLGGFDALPTESTEPLDATLQHLDRIIGDLRYWLPAPEDKMPARGWKLVKPGRAPSPEPVPESMDVDVQEDDDIPNMKIVFHPPRRVGPPDKTLCKNHLYERTRTILQAGPAEETNYTYSPTLQWYGHQLAEGRGFEHIRVTTSENFLNEHSIPDPKKVGPDAGK